MSKKATITFEYDVDDHERNQWTTFITIGRALHRELVHDPYITMVVEGDPDENILEYQGRFSDKNAERGEMVRG